MTQILAPFADTYRSLPDLWNGVEEWAHDGDPREQFADCFAALADALVRHGCADRLEISLLHAHFVIAAVECLFHFPASGGWRLAPKRWNELPDAIVPVTLKAEPDGGLVAVSYCEPGPHYRDPARHSSCLRECASILVACGRTREVGLAVVHRDDAEGEIVVWDEQRLVPGTGVREMVLVPHRGPVDRSESIPTHFRVRPDRTLVATSECYHYKH